MGAPRRSPRSPSRPHGPLGCRSFPPAPPLTDPPRPGKQQSRAHRSTNRTGIRNPLLAQPRDQKLFRHLHSAERNPLPDSNSSFLFWDLNEELPLAAKARAVPFGQAPALLVLGSVAPSKASRDPACCSPPRLCPFLACKPLPLQTPPVYPKNKLPDLLEACADVSFTDGLSDLKGLFQPKLFFDSMVLSTLALCTNCPRQTYAAEGLRLLLLGRGIQPRSLSPAQEGCRIHSQTHFLVLTQFP